MHYRNTVYIPVKHVKLQDAFSTSTVRVGSGTSFTHNSQLQYGSTPKHPKTFQTIYTVLSRSRQLWYIIIESSPIHGANATIAVLSFTSDMFYILMHASQSLHIQCVSFIHSLVHSDLCEGRPGPFWFFKKYYFFNVPGLNRLCFCICQPVSDCFYCYKASKIKGYISVPQLILATLLQFILRLFNGRGVCSISRVDV